MFKILVSPYQRKDGQWSRRRVVWAAFRTDFERNRYMDKLRMENPTWVIERGSK